MHLNLQVPGGVCEVSVCCHFRTFELYRTDVTQRCRGGLNRRDAMAHSKASHYSKKNIKEDMDVNGAKKKAAFTTQPIELSISLDTTEPVLER